ncbi:HlyD family efflux transporter periplasmic adaptor subunit [soil metagenome]
MKKIVLLIGIGICLSSCKKGNGDFDSTGVFEADEIIVSSETTGRILVMNANEGVHLDIGAVAVVIDSTNLLLQKEQIEASMNALQEKTTDTGPYIDVLEQQLSVQASQLATAEKEQVRFEKLVKADAATGKQLDDIVANIEVLRRQMQVTKKQIIQQRSSLGTQNRSVLSEEEPLSKRKEQIQDMINRGVVKNPVSGTVLTKYADAGEITTAGKALYKIANLETVTLRAYISGMQLPVVKLNQQVSVFIDQGSSSSKEYVGTITWISDKAEFTPKTIQTKEERANLVYAVKISVKNDGYLKLGMYGEVKFNK